MRSQSAAAAPGDRLAMHGDSHFRYDARGRRTANLTPQGQTQFFWDGATLIGELRLPARAARGVAANDPGVGRSAQAGAGAGAEGLKGTTGACQRWYVYEPGSFRPLACVQRRAGASADSGGDVREAPRAEVFYYHLDHLGTPREMSNAQGRIVWSARYRAWGALALADVDEVDNPLRFQGQYHDTESGLHYNFHRYYDPRIGRFIHQDPIGLDGGFNPYAYAPNPLGWVDPLGLTRQPIEFPPSVVHPSTVTPLSPWGTHSYPATGDYSVSV